MTKSSAGHLWPAGHALKTPELEHDGIEKDSGEASFVNCAQWQLTVREHNVTCSVTHKVFTIYTYGRQKS